MSESKEGGVQQAENYTDNEITEILNSAGFPKGFSLTQMVSIAYWSMFNRKRLNLLCSNIERGKSIYFSFKDANYGKM